MGEASGRGKPDLFILPVKIDDVPFQDFPIELRSILAVDFLHNWQAGLIELQEQLERFNIQKRSNQSSLLKDWHSTIGARASLTETSERYFTNWFPIELPKSVFVHKLAVWDTAIIHSLGLPKIFEAKHVLSFYSGETIAANTSIVKSKQILVEEMITNESIRIFDDFELFEPAKKLIKLLNSSFADHFYKEGMIGWKRGGQASRTVHYFRKPYERSERISLKRYGYRTNRSLTGTQKGVVFGKTQKVNWHKFHHSRNFENKRLLPASRFGPADQ